jgi:hypothetical protein
MADFLEHRRKDKIPLVGGHPFGELRKETIKLKACGQPTLLVDLDEVIVFWYFPGFIGTKNQVWFVTGALEVVHQ